MKFQVRCLQERCWLHAHYDMLRAAQSLAEAHHLNTGHTVVIEPGANHSSAEPFNSDKTGKLSPRGAP